MRGRDGVVVVVIFIVLLTVLLAYLRFTLLTSSTVVYRGATGRSLCLCSVWSLVERGGAGWKWKWKGGVAVLRVYVQVEVVRI